MVGHPRYRRPSVVIERHTTTPHSRPSERQSDLPRSPFLASTPAARFVRLGDPGADDCYRNGYGVYALVKKLLGAEKVVLTGRAGLSAFLRAFSEHILSPLYCIAQTGFTIIVDDLLHQSTVQQVLSSQSAVCVLHGLYDGERPKYRNVQITEALDHTGKVMLGCLNVAFDPVTRGLGPTLVGSIVLGEILAPESILFDRPENCDALSSPYCLVSVPWYGAETEVPPNITTRTPPIFLLMYPADFSSSAPSDMTICLRKLPPRELEISFTRDEVDFGAFWPLVPLFYLRSELAYTRHQTVLIDACLDERSFVEVGKKVSPQIVAELLGFARSLFALDANGAVSLAATRWAERKFRFTKAEAKQWELHVSGTVAWIKQMLKLDPPRKDSRHVRPEPTHHEDEDPVSRSRSTRSARPASRHDSYPDKTHRRKSSRGERGTAERGESDPHPPVQGPFYSEPSSDEDSTSAFGTCDEDVYMMPPVRTKEHVCGTKKSADFERRFSGVPAPEVPYASPGDPDPALRQSRPSWKTKKADHSNKKSATFFGIPVVSSDKDDLNRRGSRRR